MNDQESYRRNDVKLIKISDHVWTTQWGNSNSNISIINGKEYSILVDSGYPFQAQSIKLEMERNSIAPIKYVIYTHYHQDHVFGTCMYDYETVIAHSSTKNLMEIMLQGLWSERGLKRMLRNYSIMMSKLDEFHIALPTQTFDDSYELHYDEFCVTLKKAEGHCKGGIIVHVEPDDVVITGDNMFVGSYPYLLETDINEEMKILDSLLESKPAVIVPGHGDCATLDDVEYMKYYLNELVRCTKEGEEEQLLGKKFWDQDEEGFHVKNIQYIKRLMEK